MTPSLLEIRGISKSFGGLRALRDIELDVASGSSITGLIGPNGAGKTTLFNIIAGAMRPNAAAIRFDGEDVTGPPPHELFAKGLRPHLPDPAGIRAA